MNQTYINHVNLKLHGQDFLSFSASHADIEFDNGLIKKGIFTFFVSFLNHKKPLTEFKFVVDKEREKGAILVSTKINIDENTLGPKYSEFLNVQTPYLDAEHTQHEDVIKELTVILLACSYLQIGNNTIEALEAARRVALIMTLNYIGASPFNESDPDRMLSDMIAPFSEFEVSKIC